MQRFINLVAKYKVFITFTALVVISLSLISMGNVSSIGGFRTIVIGSVGWLQDLFSWIPNPGALQSENNAVRELNLQLSREVTKMRHSLIENMQLREMMKLGESIDVPYTSAEIIGRSTIEMRQYVTLDRGLEEGIQAGMTVRTDGGLVGVIVGCSSNYSLVELISNREIKVSGKVERNGINGIVVWEGGKDFYFKNIPESFDVQVGDVLITSNYSNKYPSNIPIGQIVKIEEDPASLFLSIKVDPFVDFGTIEQVFVMKQLPDPERNQLLKDMEERLKLLQ